MEASKLVPLLVSAAIGDKRTETLIGSAVSLIGIIATQFLGGWDIALKVMVYLMVADYISGLLGAIKTKTVNSEIMFWGGIRKAIVLGVIALSVLLDEFVGGQAPVFRTLVLYFYAGREGLSVVENLGVLGVPLPRIITQFLEQLKDKGEGK
ncbi:phage holin family protein [Paenibacillus radicis (ex Xue et al. 2023)]|uniref:Phage holin family protein n=1 Tax=Paenibacillus radicis (ex Xue et al. 2023) TaxID=2972489 RepID=A0ABT1YMM8_9BACL|nr:phage holin family protein [Paenibacillus radicis (ex Xue et al. 2023)]MCR8633659.1 phage holin family protein [Paenibacillus radicis (ex Xue et al. 2023)]